MTNGEINLNAAIQNMNDGKLTSYEKEFISKIKDYSKKQLNSLTGAQYKLLINCADK